ncbi:MAG: S46 family peptidase [Bacteroidetes bacterium]|nr:S46 family peptidase [Bacteroidota bacterium]MCL1968662.1 S46 family peptidase [Bacteroidota bacterium]
MKKLSFIIVSLFLFSSLLAVTPPDEGMWLPMFIKDYNYEQMQKLGLKLTPEQLYDINNSSLKDAIVQLGGGFCTGEMISKDGLMLTNHHCGYQFIFKHSTEEHDYLKNGFWAMSKEEELPNEGFYVSFLVRMEDVTHLVLDSLKEGISDAIRKKAIEKTIIKLKKDNSENGKYTVEVKSFYEENEYYMFVYINYKDIRLVGAPPSGIGKFGGDTDNWMWPRHTGDFSLFRIYTAPDGSPATYAEENIPLQPNHYLPVNIQGIDKGDYAMVWGYPGHTERFMTSYEVLNTMNVINPPLVYACDVILPSINDAINTSDRVRLLYADNYAGYANMWKMKKGETLSLARLKVAEQKAAQEKVLQNWIEQDDTRKQKYGETLSEIEQVCTNLKPMAIKCFLYANFSLSFSETLIFPYRTNVKPGKDEKKFSPEKIEKFTAKFNELRKNTDHETEMQIILATLKLWKTLPLENQPNIFEHINNNYNGDIGLFVKAISEKSIFSSEANFNKYLQKPSAKIYDNDPLIKYFQSIFGVVGSSQAIYVSYNSKLSSARNKYLAAIKEMAAEKAIYPDANSTMRVTYGQVLDYYPQEAVYYNWFTTTNGILPKEIPNDPEFDVPVKLKELILAKDYGRYGKNGVLNVCFLTNNDITGGNSGSPVINANGELIGCAFDGNWESLSSNIIYNSELQRCICVDIRYVMFVIDKVGGAGYLLNEMTIVE